MGYNERFEKLGGEIEKMKGVLIAIMYGITSASMAFVNKAVLSYYGFSYPFFLVTCQMVFSIVLMETLRVTNRITLARFTFARGYRFIIPSTCYAINSVLALSALSGMNIPMYGVIKRCAPVMILIMGRVILGKGMASKQVVLSVATITTGCFIAGYGDLTFDPKAYAHGAASVVSQALYLILVQKNAKDLGATETLYLNSYNTLPLLLICCSVFGEHRQAVTAFYSHSDSPMFLILFSVVISVGCALNYLLFLCTTYNSALTTSVTGTLKSIVQTAIGLFTFGGIQLNFATVMGISMNLSGGVWYSLVKYRESRQKTQDSGKLVCLPSSACVVDMQSSNGGKPPHANGKITNGLNGFLKTNGHTSNGHPIGQTLIDNGKAFVEGKHHL